MARVLILGTNGMLGSMVSSVLSDCGHDVIGTDRVGSGLNVKFDALTDSVDRLISSQESLDYVINAIGIIKPRINEEDRQSRLTAIEINAKFPHLLAESAEIHNVSVIQIATDCVFSGITGMYDEKCQHDALDVYGKTKSLGEVLSPNVFHLRASIIGPEVGRQTSLWEWVRSQPLNSKINGFANHKWNGVTTFHFGKVCNGIMQKNERHSGLHHLVPNDIVTKADLVRGIAEASGRTDLEIDVVMAKDSIDRTLTTTNKTLNYSLWTNAGYSTPPSVLDMVRETPL